MKRNRRKKKRQQFLTMGIIILLTVLLVILVSKIFDYFLPANESVKNKKETSKLTVETKKETVPETKPETMEPVAFDTGGQTLYSPYAILIRLDDDQVVYETRSEERAFPASLTKMMTVIVAIENLPDLQADVTIPEDIYQALYEANASLAGFSPGETVPAIDLLYGTMLPSGAEASIGLAEIVAGSESAFVEMMNKKASELGMANTHFANVEGLHDENHYSTAKDMAVLMEYALKNETFRKIITSVSYTTSPTNMNPDGITFYSTVLARIETTDINGGEILGGKTGYTPEAGLCLASLALKDGREYILITMGAPGNHQTEQFHFMDALKVYGTYLGDNS